MTMTSASFSGDLTPVQVRAARGWLAWSQKDLAEAAGVATSTVADFERGQRTPIPAHAEALRSALEKGGARFRPDGGVTGPLPPIIQRTKRPGMSVRWVEAQDLSDWANRVDGALSLPTLVAHLITASLGNEVRLRFPSAEGVRYAGWDGRSSTSVADDPYVPHGEAGWELSAQRDGIKAKATGDYDKRTAEPGMDRAQATFVFVTLHVWPDKDKWAKDRTKAGDWRDVRVYDAADLVHWIERTPAVGLWLATRLGKRPQDVRELDAVWEEWSLATQWPLSKELVLGDRDEDAVVVQRWLRGEPAVLSLQATTADEVVAFFHATIAQMPRELSDAYHASCVVATTAAGARALAESPAPLYILLTEPDPGLARRLVKHGHFVLLAYDERLRSHDDVRVLARPSRDEIERVLVAAGLATAAAARYARDCARNLAVLRRLIPAAPGGVPRWAETSPPRALLAALLVGGWDTGVDADRRCVADLAGEAYTAVIAALTPYVGGFDRPLRQVGAIWRVASPYDAWQLLAQHLTGDDLDRFERVARAVLCTRDPRFDVAPDERWMAAVRGIQPEHSPTLRHGIGQVLILLALWGGKVHTVPDAKRRVDSVVEAVLREADEARWWSLSHDFRLLAEASPNAFLAAIEDSLDKAAPPVRVLLATHEGGLFGAEYLSNLLWALETLAWSAEWLPRVTHVLARLDALDTKPGRHSNRPINSLREIYVLWNPQTFVPLEDRLRVLDTVRGEEPAAAWKLLLALLPSGQGFSMPSPIPRWRDFSVDKPEAVTRAMFWQGAARISEWLTEDAGTSATRWAELLERFNDLVPDCKEALTRLEAAERAIAEPGDRAMLWEALRHQLHRHRQFPDAKWSLKADVLAQLDAIYRKLAPDEPLQRVAWLFEQRAELPDPPGDGWAARERAVDAARRDAAQTLLSEGGTAAVLALASMVDATGYVGKALHDNGLSEPTLDALLETALTSHDARLRKLAHGLIMSAFRDGKEAWAEKLIATAKDRGWDDTAMLTILRALPMQWWTWQQASRAGASVDDAYWKHAPILWVSDEPNDVVFAIQKLIAAGRARHAVGLAHPGDKVSLPSPLLVEVLTSAYEQPLQPSDDSNDATMFQYHVAEILQELDRRGDVPAATVADLEWKYLTLLEHSTRRPKVLPKVLAESPALFIRLLRAVFRPSAESGIVEPQPDDPEQARLRAEQSYRLLEMWDVVPGTREDGTIDGAVLEAWIDQARSLANTAGRPVVADIRIGNVLSASPMGQDGHWPAEAVRKVLDLFRSEDIFSGFEIGTYNRRGVTTRDPHDGGALERQEAAKYRAWAKAIGLAHRYTAKSLHSIADSYERDAGRHDESAELVDYEY